MTKAYSRAYDVLVACLSRSMMSPDGTASRQVDVHVVLKCALTSVKFERSKEMMVVLVYHRIVPVH